MIVKCPRCGEQVEWKGNDCRPFCSESCKLIDLGDWISEEYGIPEQTIKKDDLDSGDS